MKNIRHTVLGLALLGLLFLGGGDASAKEPGKPLRGSLSGVILSINREERTITVREFGTDRVFTTLVPKGKTVKTNFPFDPNKPIERLLPGMFITGVGIRQV